MIQARNLGFPRMGAKRELKFAVERFWAGQAGGISLEQTATELRRAHWQLQVASGIDVPPSNDFSLYDHVLDTAFMLGAIPSRFRSDQTASIDNYFRMARGAKDAPAMEMTKWFDTNYHYIVPEFEEGMTFHLHSSKPMDEYLEAKTLGIHTRPVLLGPVSFVLLGKFTTGKASQVGILESIIPIYREVLTQLHKAGADWVQIDEPYLVLDLNTHAHDLYRKTYEKLLKLGNIPQILLTTYFAGLKGNLEIAVSLPVQGLHIDNVRSPEQLASVCKAVPAKMRLSLGLVDGRNVWRTDLNKALGFIHQAVEVLGSGRIEIAPSCSLLHVPVDLDQEEKLDPEVRNWMAFAKQKLQEVSVLALAAAGDRAALDQIAASKEMLQLRQASPRVHNPDVRKRISSVDERMLNRKSPHSARATEQAAALHLPLLPTTTIGSFPQTAEVRQMRASFKAGKLDLAGYEKFLEEETMRCLRFQEETGIDVLVHGEFERNDMVEYFGEQLSGFAFSQHGWVQSYGSRCVRPPIIFGDVARPHPMTVRWSRFAQSQTTRPVKGMLTGPVTILQWSFVRDDQPRSETCRQIALAVRDEVADLESAGIRVIQIDEPAIREGLPLHRNEWPAYLKWSVECFRLASAGVLDQTQIHTHMCYSEFNDIIDSIVHMDADVISIECSRSRMELLDAFHRVRYPNEIGPGVYDIHSPRVPENEEIENLLRKALEVLTPEQLWVNPDCGLKTRGWAEVRLALGNMVSTAAKLRAALPSAVSTKSSHSASKSHS
jgi:5-methyltetrahydropteroyltriglutamate--homocysteine methyltransferase